MHSKLLGNWSEQTSLAKNVKSASQDAGPLISRSLLRLLGLAGGRSLPVVCSEPKPHPCDLTIREPQNLSGWRRGAISLRAEPPVLARRKKIQLGKKDREPVVQTQGRRAKLWNAAASALAPNHKP